MFSVCFLYRKPVGHFFSIEKVFNTVSDRLKDKIQVKSFLAPRYNNSVLGMLINMFFALRLKSDIYHITGEIHYIILTLPRNKAILTIHDCDFMSQPASGIKHWFLYHLFLKWPVAHAKYVTTISENSKKEIIKYTGCHENKIVVIPNMVEDSIEYRKKSFNTYCPVLLFIGSTPNKNLMRVAEALNGLNCLLDIVGKLDESALKKLDENDIQYRVAHSLTSAQMKEKYYEADLILFPSLVEGFGLPIVEAQKAGRGVITSELSPMKEVAGPGGAHLVDPYQVSSIREGVLKMCSDSNYRNTVIEKGFENVKRYSTDIVSEQYLALYLKIGTK